MTSATTRKHAAPVAATDLIDRSDSLARHAAFFHALSDPRRLRILDLLRGGERCVCDLQADFGIGQSLLSFHLKTLRDSGLVSVRKEGRWSHYQLVPSAFDHAEQAIAAYRVPAHERKKLPLRCCI